MINTTEVSGEAILSTFGGQGWPAADHAGGAFSAPLSPPNLAGGEGAGCPLPKNPTIVSALWASSQLASPNLFPKIRPCINDCCSAPNTSHVLNNVAVTDCSDSITVCYHLRVLYVEGGGACVSAEEEGVHHVPRDARHGARESEPRPHSRVQVSTRAVQPVQPQTRPVWRLTVAACASQVNWRLSASDADAADVATSSASDDHLVSITTI